MWTANSSPQCCPVPCPNVPQSFVATKESALYGFLDCVFEAGVWGGVKQESRKLPTQDLQHSNTNTFKSLSKIWLWQYVTIVELRMISSCTSAEMNKPCFHFRKPCKTGIQSVSGLSKLLIIYKNNFAPK